MFDRITNGWELAKDSFRVLRLIGPWPEERELYKQRSPVYFAEQLSCPVTFFQGDEDKIVPPNQAEVMVEALKGKGVPVAYVLFAGEKHGFRQSENIRRALDGEFWFYAHIFKFELADEIKPIEVWKDAFRMSGQRDSYSQDKFE